MEQANTKEIIATDEFENLKIIAKPNLKTLGPRLRGDAPKVMKHLTEADGSEIKSILDAEGSYSVEVDGKSIELGVDDILFETELPENLVSADFDSGNVFINTEVTEEILSEAMSRELIRRVQDMRKDLDLDVEANIHVFVECDEGFKELIKPFFDFISNEVRAEKLSFEAQEGDYTKEWKIEDENLKITIKKT
jgi:isoleucyl-tRNA synthetase